MNSTLQSSLNTLRKIYRKAFLPSFTEMNFSYVQYKGQPAANIIKSALLSDQPVNIAKFGSTEMKNLANYNSIKNNSGEFIKYIRNEIEPYWWDMDYITEMGKQSGFFPTTVDMVEKFAEMTIQDMKEVDILGSWLENEKLFFQKMPGVVKVEISDLYPYNHKEPWSEALAGKKVLVVHPFEKSIRLQYAKRALIFQDQRILPEFELKTLKAVQGIAHNKTAFNSWFQALNYMKEKVSEIDFDIAILGCGAYGFPLAAYIKRMRKKAVHMGGATQILFGIKGKRWEEGEGNAYVSKLFMNEHWVRPSKDELPENHISVEGGAYW